jgi:hypothetical protein
MSSSKKFTCKGILPQVFVRVYRQEILSVMIVFSIQLAKCWPSTCAEYTDSEWLVGGEAVGGVESCWRPYCAGVTLCSIIPDSEPTTLLDHPKQKHRRRGGPDR